MGVLVPMGFLAYMDFSDASFELFSVCGAISKTYVDLIDHYEVQPFDQSNKRAAVKFKPQLQVAQPGDRPRPEARKRPEASMSSTVTGFQDQSLDFKVRGWTRVRGWGLRFVTRSQDAKVPNRPTEALAAVRAGVASAAFMFCIAIRIQFTFSSALAVIPWHQAVPLPPVVVS
ncbi:unnamed protein product [Phytophthora fragariaefolia]|uniref:Unnamed protein product n=1 Tax=Phytophthora fragariaefolia TaxID=1490495 RepID=A0A9W6X889_9STRA|nr:unnamed protein product [Phytophthora fragariaefolia]